MRYPENGESESAQNLRVGSSVLYLALILGEVTNSHWGIRIWSIRELQGPCGKIFRDMALRYCLHHFAHMVVKIARNGGLKGNTVSSEDILMKLDKANCF